ncbi:retron Ec67 family RNA-directed DNA polymerase/endonuclease [Sphingobium yanoikuyae]|uniref:RNA-directed DNA polymerase n=2 Tax=Sphingomonadaceae TaxID=41297 RepID=A0AA43BDH2_SPHYA|nr:MULTISPECIES: retron Ec67 family RNA-directed DNA polymerase/endonuclease [Sphingomonadaceae]MBM7405014.1 retron-type reverse transcriptase [Sphingomonas sp. JUb134]MDH2133544.1 retron Ec67 family RNA-directed DNA polymerase/endonuclease [Sphingobium yanoikuyae]MDH2152679.1 retron Ec67 family RNA-directed DNA polymerase/endonuclease [Sphingobium yanoikuyae]MDH2168899.1 retron Ec67 family RNA-directed DNA polymerase/endonuclease [Sphingobium yanoikuyae]MDT7530118.1 retron Ec67 family RNA-dir
MSSLAKLQAAKSLDDLAAILGYKPAALAYLLYHLPDAQKYTAFTIPKRDGTPRAILAPTPKLKLLQRRLANVLYLALADIDKVGSPRRQLSHGFAKHLSIVTNAAVHKRRRYVLNLDIKDFFPSINFGRVRGMFIKDKRFALDPKIATLIAQIACHDHVLPQGSPCSPVISNVVGHLLDIRLVRFAKAQKCTYSRYADDITFSTNAKAFPPDIAAPVAGSEHDWTLGAALLKEIEKAGFEVNPTKTRMQYRGSRQVATGLLVNEKPNVRPEYYRTVRAMCWSLFNSGTYYRMVPAALAGGKAGDPDVPEPATSLAPLQGMLGHVYHVRDQVDTRPSADKKKDATATATRKLYIRFLFYRNFVVAPKPLIIPEGKTDTVYLRAAMEKLTAYHPRLGAMDKGKFKPALKFMKFSSTIHDVLQLGNGAGDLFHFIRRYPDALKRYRHRPLPNPIIVLIDNDDGAKEIFGAAKGLGAAHIARTSTDPFYRLAPNLYLIKTPEIGAQGISCIEDLFDPALLKTVIDGKVFDPNKKHGEAGKYGKARFAEKVVQPQKDTIDFSKFAGLLDRIVAALDDYVANPPPP